MGQGRRRTFFERAADQSGQKLVKCAEFFVDRSDIVCALKQGEVSSPGTAGKKR